MLKGICQLSPGLLREIQRDGCLFLCLAWCSPRVFEGTEGIESLNNIWKIAKEEGVIDWENNLTEHNVLAQCYFGIDARYDYRHHGVNEEIPESVKFILGQFFWKYGHFVIIDRDKNVVFDPLINSASVKNGALKSMRWYYAV